MDEDVLRLLLGKADGVLQQVALVLVDAALLLHLVYQHQQLLRGHFVVPIQMKHPGQQLFPQGKQRVQRHQQPDQAPQKRCGCHGPVLGAVLGDALGGDLAEDQHHHRYHDGGQRSAGIAEAFDEQCRGQGCHGNVHDVVADQDGGQQLVIALQQPARQRGTAVAFFRQHFQPRDIGRGERRLRGREIGGQQQAYRHNNDICSR